MKKLYLILALIFVTYRSAFAVNVLITQSSPYTMDSDWAHVCDSLGYSYTDILYTALSSNTWFSTTDILIITAYTAPLTPALIDTLESYIREGGKIYMQSEYMSSFATNQAFQQIVNDLGGSFTWGGTTNFTLAPMNELGSLATTPFPTTPLPYFWYGCWGTGGCNSHIEPFLEYLGQYFGFIFCDPHGNGRMITQSDQDWVQTVSTYPAGYALMKNILSNLVSPSYTCVATGSFTVYLGPDTTVCGGSVVLNATTAGAVSYLWSTGATTPTITVSATGTYWVDVSNGTCTASDTVVVSTGGVTTVLSPRICAGASYVLPNGVTVSAPGTYRDSFIAVSGCDSFVTTNLSILVPATTSVNLSGCSAVTFHGVTYTFDQTAVDTVRSRAGCDSVYNMANITIIFPSLYQQFPSICLGQTFSVGTNTFSSTGYYIDTLRHAAASGCDSIVYTHLTVISPFPQTISPTGICAVIYGGRTYTSDALFYDTIRSQLLGCDSVYLTVQITVLPATDTVINNPVCIYTGQSYFAGGQNRTTSGIYMDTVRTLIGGCDSIITRTDLTVISPQNIRQRIDSCHSSTIGGVTYTSDTIISDTILSVCGLDSVIVIDTLGFYAPSISIVSSDSLPMVAGDSTQLSIIPAGSYQDIVWNPNLSISNIHSASPIVSPLQSTSYAVTAEDSNHCVVTADILVTVTASDSPAFVMPTAFSPNGDGRNDTFAPVLSAGAMVMTFHIYDRWGELIYDAETSGSDGWDGGYEGVSQPVGVYTYFITVKGLLSGKITNQQGNLTLFR